MCLGSRFNSETRVFGSLSPFEYTKPLNGDKSLNNGMAYTRRHSLDQCLYNAKFKTPVLNRICLQAFGPSLSVLGCRFRLLTVESKEFY